MPDSYRELLDATLQYLETLKERGERWIAVSPEALAMLAAPVPRAPAVPATKPVPTQPERAPAPEPERRAAVEPSATVTVVEAIASLPSDKVAALAEVREQTLACQKCPHLAGSRKHVVFGVGDVNAALMFVGEAPGADEDVQGEPFVGAAGQLLTRIIKAMGFSRETVYIANILKCRPDTPGQTSGNRKPTSDEMNTCLPYLREQIRLIQPKVIVTLGATAMEGLFGKPVAITKMRGRWQQLGSVPVMPTYHPSYLLRNQSLSVKREVWEDMLQVLEKLGVSITEKQRNYFKESAAS